MAAARAVAGLAAGVVLGHRDLLRRRVGRIVRRETVAGGVAGRALGFPVVLLPVRLPLLVDGVPLLVHELQVASGRVLDQVALLPVRADDEHDVGHRGALAVDVALGRAGVALAVLRPVVAGVLQQCFLRRADHLGVQRALPRLVLFGMTAAALLGADERGLGVALLGVGGAPHDGDQRKRRQPRRCQFSEPHLVFLSPVADAIERYFAPAPNASSSSKSSQQLPHLRLRSLQRLPAGRR